MRWLKGLLSLGWLVPRSLELPPEGLTADSDEVLQKVQQTKQIVVQTAEDVERHTLAMKARMRDLEDRVAFYEQARR